MSQNVMHLVDKTSVIVHIGGYGSETKLYKYNVDPDKCYFIDPMFPHTSLSDHHFRMVIGDKDGHEKVYFAENWQNTSIFKNVAQSKKRPKRIPCRTMDTFIEENDIGHIDLLICNAEGAEYRLFCAETADWLLNTDKIAIDLHLGIVEEQEEWIPFIINTLKELHFEVQIKNKGNYLAVFAERK